MSNEIEKECTEIETTVANGNSLVTGRDMNNEARIYKMLTTKANMYANSSIVPEVYKGNANNCYVALELAHRMGAPEMLVLQNLYIVKGKPTWSGQACIALIKGSGIFKDFEFVEVGERGQKSWGYYCKATRKRDGKVVNGVVVDMALASAEGWIDKPGSKWKTMPEQMLRYRAGAFFARTECPEVLMGVMVEGETEDVYGAEEDKIEKVIIRK